MVRISVILVLFCACTAKPAPQPLTADSINTANAVRRIEGKPMRTFTGPSEILGDTAKNRRYYLKKRE